MQLWPTFLTIQWQEALRGAEENGRRGPGQRGGADQVGGGEERRHGLEGARPLRRPAGHAIPGIQFSRNPRVLRVENPLL